MSRKFGAVGGGGFDLSTAAAAGTAGASITMFASDKPLGGATGASIDRFGRKSAGQSLLEALGQ